MELVSYSTCDAMLAALRNHLAAHVGDYGLYPDYGYYRGVDVVGAAAAQEDVPGLAPVPAPAAPTHSTTNVQETGIGEPDIVATDGERVVSVSDGVLRVVDATTHKITGSLDLSVYAGADGAQLFLDGDRVLAVLGTSAPYGGPVPEPYGGPVPQPYGVGGSATGTTLILLDIADEPRIISTLHTDGSYLDARMVGDTARFVVQSTPRLVFPSPRGGQTRQQLVRHNRGVVRHAPLSAWLPTYQVTGDGTTTTRTVPCTGVSHPTHYTGKSMVTIYTVNLTGDLTDPAPMTLATDGTAVYASPSSLYVANTFSTRDQRWLTQLHRFDITGPGRPAYLGSNTVPGTLLNSYSMSEYDGALRVVTTKNNVASTLPRPGPAAGRTTTSVYLLDANTLKVEGHVDGLGRGEQVQAVRFLGPLGYVVTFRSIDPLYVLDLHDPAKPREVGVLHASGYSNYLHPVADGRLLGVGETVDGYREQSGLQVSLFDVASPERPKLLDRLRQHHRGSAAQYDPHAFLYWPASRIAVLPISSWNADASGAALVVHVGTDHLSVVGTIRNPAVSSTDSYDTGIERTLVIRNRLWTMSSAGLRVSDLHTLDRQAWVPFD
jgi:uncharacterized secreted protein with C-terminal beta-propeller domain